MFESFKKKKKEFIPVVEEMSQEKYDNLFRTSPIHEYNTIPESITPIDFSREIKHIKRLMWRNARKL